MATLLVGMYLAANPMSYFGSALLMYGANMIDQSVFGPKYTSEGARLNDLKLQASSYGSPMPKVYGQAVRVPGNVIWGTNFVEHVSTSRQGGKGGGGGGSVTTTEYSYSVSFAVALCEGPIQGIARVWADGKLLDLSRYNVATYLGTESQLPDEFIEGIEGIGNVPAYRGIAYVVFKNFYVDDFGRRIPNLTFEVIPALSDLDDVIVDISADAGVHSTDIDVSDLVGIRVPGYIVSGNNTFRSRVEYLSTIFNFDGSEKNGKVVFQRRNLDNIYTGAGYKVDPDDLGAYETERPEDIYKVTRRHDYELPRSVSVNYTSKDKDYQNGSMPAKRVKCRSNKDVTIDLPIVLTDVEAKKIAERKLYETWLNRTSYDTSLPQKYSFLFPGDIVQIPIKQSKRIGIITKTTFGRPGLMKVACLDISGTIYHDISRIVDEEITAGVGRAPTAVTVEFLDIPKLPWDTTPDGDQVYAAATADVYWGASVYRTDDDGTTYRLMANIPRQATMGKALTLLDSGIASDWDNVNTVDVLLYHGTLESRPEADVLNGFNGALLGSEIFQFRTATLIAENTYRLSGLMRGRLGSETEIGNHVLDERFVLLDSSIAVMPVLSTDLDAMRQYRVGPSILPVTDTIYTDVTFVHRGSSAAAPPNVDYFSVSVLGSDLVFSFRRNDTDGVINGYDIRRGELFESSQLVARVAGKETDQATIPAIAGRGQKYWIAAFNDSGYCANPLFDTIDVDSLPEREVVITTNDYINPSVALTGNGVTTCSAIIQKGGPSYDELLAKTYTQLLTTSMFGPAIDYVTVTGEVIDIGKIGKVIVTVNERWTVSPDQPSIIEIMTSTDNTNWTDWKLLTAGVVNARYIKVRLTIRGIKKAGVLQGADVSVHAFVNTVVYRDLAIPVGGFDIVFPQAYINKPAIMVTPNGMIRSTKKTNESRAGAKLQLMSADGLTDLGGVADLIIVGF